MAVSGVGDQAYSFAQSLCAGSVNEGVVATKRSMLVSIGATDTPATLAQVDAAESIRSETSLTGPLLVDYRVIR